TGGRSSRQQLAVTLASLCGGRNTAGHHGNSHTKRESHDCFKIAGPVRCQLPHLCVRLICADFKIGLVVQNGFINESLIENAASRRGSTRTGESCLITRLCSEPGLAGLIGVGCCSLLDQLAFIQRVPAKLPFIALPTALCDAEPLLKGHTVVGSHRLSDMLDAAVQARHFRFHCQHEVSLQSLQSGLAVAGVSSLTFQVDTAANVSVTPQLVQHLRPIVKKKVFKLLLLAPVRAINYFWLLLDTGLSEMELLSATPTNANANVSLLRGGVFKECSAAVMDVFPDEMDVRFVDAVEAMARALDDSLTDPGFSPSNATCFPMQRWSFGSTVLHKLISTVILNGMAVDILRYLAEKLDFRRCTSEPGPLPDCHSRPSDRLLNGPISRVQRDPVAEAPGARVPPVEPVHACVFTYKVWLTIVGTIVGCSLIAWLFAFFSPFSPPSIWVRLCSRRRGVAEGVPVELQSAVALLACSKGPGLYPFAMSARAILASWWFFIVIIYAIYSTLDDLVTQTAVTPYVRRGTNLFDLLNKARSSGVYKQLARASSAVRPGCGKLPVSNLWQKLHESGQSQRWVSTCYTVEETKPLQDETINRTRDPINNFEGI
uniref:PBPe domain-containing protein n=1 Tax=Macrostomum lignano TaxID=282301 RepID=A0A1I8FBX0_9PLAT